MKLRKYSNRKLWTIIKSFISQKIIEEGNIIILDSDLATDNLPTLTSGVVG